MNLTKEKEWNTSKKIAGKTELYRIKNDDFGGITKQEPATEKIMKKLKITRKIMDMSNQQETKTDNKRKMNGKNWNRYEKKW